MAGERRTRWNVLFLCTGNSARSIIAESICNTRWRERLRGFSAGSHPKGRVHPSALHLLTVLGHDTTGLRSKGWEAFAGPGAPRMDFVITVCDAAAGEACPVWPGQPMSAHWGMPDPARSTGTEAEIAVAFDQAYAMLDRRIGIFASLPLATLDGLSLRRALDDIGGGEAPCETGAVASDHD